MSVVTVICPMLSSVAPYFIGAWAWRAAVRVSRKMVSVCFMGLWVDANFDTLS